MLDEIIINPFLNANYLLKTEQNTAKSDNTA